MQRQERLFIFLFGLFCWPTDDSFDDNRMDRPSAHLNGHFEKKTKAHIVQKWIENNEKKRTRIKTIEQTIEFEPKNRERTRNVYICFGGKKLKEEKKKQKWFNRPRDDQTK